MSRQILLPLVVVLILAAIGGYFAYNRFINPTSLNLAQNATTGQPQASINPSKQGSLKDLISQRNVRCEVSYPEQNGQGEVFVGDKKVRVDSSIKIAEKNVVSHMIQDGDFLYMWTEDSDMGTKMKFDTSLAQPAASAGKQQTANLDQKVDYECSNWSVDSSKFILPTNVKFSDLSSLLPQASGDAPIINKSICDQISDPQSKAACLNALQ